MDDSSESSPSAEAHTRRSFLNVEAIDPSDGKRFNVLLSHSRLRLIASRSRGQTLEARDSVPLALQYPTAIFQGLCRDADESASRGVGWRCYVAVPTKTYTKDGTEINPYPGEVFLVFINADRVAYNWYWDKCDPDDKTLPRGWKSRFRERLL